MNQIFLSVFHLLSLSILIPGVNNLKRNDSTRSYDNFSIVEEVDYSMCHKLLTHQNNVY